MNYINIILKINEIIIFLKLYLNIKRKIKYIKI